MQVRVAEKHNTIVADASKLVIQFWFEKDPNKESTPGVWLRTRKSHLIGQQLICKDVSHNMV